jgi:ankyrin repeat protein
MSCRGNFPRKQLASMAMNKLDSQLLHACGIGGDDRAVERNICHGADVNAKHPINGRTPLHVASKYDRTETVRILVENGANINAQDDTGSTPTVDNNDPENDGYDTGTERIRRFSTCVVTIELVRRHPLAIKVCVT